MFYSLRVFGQMARDIAIRKGYCGAAFYWFGFFLLFIGVLIVLCLPDRTR